MGLSATAKARGLTAALGGSLSLGLGVLEVDDGIVEIVDASYMRQHLELDLKQQGNDVEMVNRGMIDFPPFDDDVADEAVRYWFITDQDGELRASGELTPRVVNGTEMWTPHLAGWSVRFPSGDVRVRLTDGGSA